MSEVVITNAITAIHPMFPQREGVFPFFSVCGGEWTIERTLREDSHYGAVISTEDHAFDRGSDPLWDSAAMWNGL